MRRERPRSSLKKERNVTARGRKCVYGCTVNPRSKEEDDEQKNPHETVRWLR